MAFAWILGIIFLALGVTGIVWSRMRLQRQKAEMLFALEVNGRFCRQLLTAQDAQTVIRAAMQAAVDLLQTKGVSFLPFDEWRLSFPALYQGDVPADPKGDWSRRLTDPSIRQACKMCQKRTAGATCGLLVETQGPVAAWCMPLRQAGREIGMLSFYLPRQRLFREEQHAFLKEMVSIVDVALESVQKQPRKESEEAGPIYQAVLDERTRLAREIHDGLAQTLAFLKMETARMQKSLEQGQIESLRQGLQAHFRTLADAYLDARQAIDDLRRQPDADLLHWMTNIAADFETLTGISVDVRLEPPDLSFPPQVSTQLMRIVQEALTNVRKHAQAAHVYLHLTRLEADILLEIQDDGRGFTPLLGLSASRYGLRGMRERAESIGADFQVISRLGGGTTVQVRLPARLQEVS
jgi:two-component system nitrate/nitrite sensor histidine kinase NarX